MFPNRYAEHQADKTVSVQVGRTPVSGMIKQEGNIFKIRNQSESYGGSDVHEPGVIRFRMGTGIIKGIERFPGNTG